VKSLRSHVLILLALSFLLACQKSNTPASSTNNPSGNSTPTPADGANQTAANAPTPAPPLVIPAGTLIVVRLADALSSKTSQQGQEFSATVAQPVEMDGQTVIPKGATAHGTVVSAQPMGRFKGGASLEVRLDRVSIGDKNQAIQTTAVARSASGKGERSAGFIGGGAAAGALIGAIAGRGKGAAIGALAGGGAGTAGAAFTGNKDIVLPAESALSFKLTQALEVGQ
jgi:hypothetical protein